MQQVISTWETGTSLLPLDRALVILAEAGVPGSLDELSLARRDRTLLQIRSETFGDSLSATASCPACEAIAEIELGCRDLANSIIEQPAEQLELAGCTVSVRSLSSRDLADAVRSERGEADLVRRLIGTDETELNEGQLDVARARIEEREREIELRIGLSCPECGHEWSALFEPLEFVWAEISAAAQQALREVAEIAAGFGWSEAAILSLSEVRRRHYLRLLRLS